MHHQHLMSISCYFGLDCVDVDVGMRQCVYHIYVALLLHAAVDHVVAALYVVVLGVGEQQRLEDLHEGLSVGGLDDRLHELDLRVLFDLLQSGAGHSIVRQSESLVRDAAGQDYLLHQLRGHFCQFHRDSSSETPANCETLLHLLNAAEVEEVSGPVSEVPAWL